MKKYLYLAVFLCAAVLAGCESTDVGGRAMAQDLRNREIEAAKGLVAFQKEVVEKASNPEDRERAHNILDMLMERAIIVVPTQNGIWIPPFVDDKDSVRIVPLVRSDEKYDFWKKRFIDTPDAASYSPAERMLVLGTYAEVSPKFVGLIWAHEGNHAFSNATTAYWPKTKQAFCEQERDTHEFQYRLTADVGGAAYKKLLQDQVVIMHNTVKNTSKVIGTSFPDVSDNHEALNRVFGPAYSDFEKDFRNTHLWTDTIFHLIDRYFAGDKERQKAALLCAIYDELGVQTPK
jgi:hypothetical protein